MKRKVSKSGIEYSNQTKVSPLGCLVIILILIGLSNMIPLPTLLNYRKETRSGLCQNHLKSIEHAKKNFSIKESLPEGTIVTEEQITPYLCKIDGKAINIKCPESGTISINPIGKVPTCSYHTPEESSKPSEKEKAAKYWRNHNNSDDSFGCWADKLVTDFGGEVAAPLLLESLRTNPNPDGRVGVIGISALRCWGVYDTNGHLSAVVVKGLYDTNAVVREVAIKQLRLIKDFYDEKYPTSHLSSVASAEKEPSEKKAEE